MSTFTVLNPATEETVATVPSTSVEETDAAIARAVAAQAAWRAVAPGERAALLRAFADAVDTHNEELAGLEVAGSGHPVGQARWEAGNVRDVLRYYSAAPERLCGKQIPVPGGVNVTFQEPVGVVGLIVPWNFPMPILGWGLGPALAAGNPVIAKPACRTGCSRSCRARARWWVSAWSTTSTSARSCSPAPPRSASRSWPAAPGR
jgi:acyl-CoA reductase-like NAD-dependent aldehyde dehydrogenase